MLCHFNYQFKEAVMTGEINRLTSKPWAIDESTITTKTYPIDINNLPKGLYWDKDGACYQAKLCNIDPADNGWRWAARNPLALGKGYSGQELHPHYPYKDTSHAY